MPLYAARVQDLGPDDVAVFKCGACGHTAELWPSLLIGGLGLQPTDKVLDLERRLRCRLCYARTRPQCRLSGRRRTESWSGRWIPRAQHERGAKIPALTTSRRRNQPGCRNVIGNRTEAGLWGNTRTHPTAVVEVSTSNFPVADCRFSLHKESSGFGGDSAGSCSPADMLARCSGQKVSV